MDKRKLGLEIIAAMYANCYGVSLENGREMTLNIINVITARFIARVVGL